MTRTETPTRTRYVIAGTCDDIPTCECCGTRIKKAVMLHPIDEEGNREDLVFYGTTCAAKVLNATRTAVTNTAGAEDNAWRARVAYAKEVLAVYGPVEGNRRETAILY